MSSLTTTEHRTVEHVVMASEIERLPDLQGYLKLASYPDWCRVALSRVEYSARPRESEAGPPGSDAAAARPQVTPASVTPVVSARQAAPVRAAKPRVAIKRPRKSAVKAAESNAVGDVPGVGGEQCAVSVESAPTHMVARADAAPQSLE